MIKAGYPAVLGWKMPYWRHSELRERAEYLAPEVMGGVQTDWGEYSAVDLGAGP